MNGTPDTISATERALIDAAIAKGRVEKIPTGKSSHSGYRFNGETNKLEAIEPSDQNFYGRGHKNRIKPKVAKRRMEVRRLMMEGKGAEEISTILNAPISVIYLDARHNKMEFSAAILTDEQKAFITDEMAEALPSNFNHRKMHIAILKLASDGLSITEISEQTGAQKKTIAKFTKRYGIKFQRMDAEEMRQRMIAAKASLRNKTAERREKLPGLIAKGLSGKEIAEELNCSKATVYNDCARMNLSIPRKTGQRCSG